ncbi:hypothetical protein [Liquorilactobacillus oeni]|uniref:Uncharacterized protein n=1 Tax=Liquorilactobacillus oeni DSM 19972 TaxID=1423777 RepID=A0A0R1MIC9_9LACO|nr:hypothetical protein [Liquorilactobacillus oeni]KRL04906.1 hypothetical protein FD46_GL002045 [Liquorilactobacillus oeni DSM 19972]
MNRDLKYFNYRLDICLDEALDAQQAVAKSSEALDDDIAMIKVIQELKELIKQNEFIQRKLYKVYKEYQIDESSKSEILPFKNKLRN